MLNHFQVVMRLTVSLVQVFDRASAEVLPLLNVVFHLVRKALALVDCHDLHHFENA